MSMTRKLGFHLLLMLSLSFPLSSTRAQTAALPETLARAVEISRRYMVEANITYITANNYEAKLDVYRPRDLTQPNPVVIFIHGGGWVAGTKEGSALELLPYLMMGFSVVNVEYRLARVSLAPAAVEDCRCALQWVIRNAERYKFDTNKIVVTGMSAGGHLALMTGMLPAAAGLDRQCSGTTDMKVAAIINWYGITDVNDLLDGPNMKGYAVVWLGSQINRDEIARRVSPLTYVRAGLPPILTIHGDADPTVPYDHAVRLHQALDRAGVPNQLLTIPGGKHGGFNAAETQRIYATIRDFLARYNLLPPGQ
ncbi:alpha/beta hydrolase [Pyrinomonas methylaliphatogenes]|uniref:Esterase/lipase n=1 Tax=Pyrinomonas methylaliphatogenes TaxID=454194 RepID=A0A0B6WXG9_9BACT|nr:alpha/beta hydrolase [Pyrinomonas methylaliphatogenes]CDM64870.1 esterase/lipase [Pyrinomonas methylaliphatogenes]